MTVIVDANTTLASVLPLPYSAAADRRADEWGERHAVLAAPELWTYEVITGLRRAVWLGLIEPEQLEVALTLVEELDLELFPPTPALNRIALDWADRLHQAKACDGHYLAVAEQLRAEYWTADQRLVRSLAELGVEWVHWIGED